MGKAWRLIPSALLVITGVAVAFYHSRPAPEPVYEGKPLRYWLGAYLTPLATVPPPGAPSWKEANAAIYEIGTNAIPTLLDLLQTRDSPFEDGFFALLQKLHFTNARRRPAWFGQTQAMYGLAALGIKASSAVPRLTEMYARSHDFNFQLQVAALLGMIGPAARNGVPVLLRAVTNRNEIIRLNAAWSLGCVHAAPAESVPALTQRLRDSSPAVRRTAARVLAEFGKDARPAIPALLALQRSETGAKSSSATALPPVNKDFWGGVTYSPTSNMPFSTPRDLGEVAAEALWTIDPGAAAKAAIVRPKTRPW